MPRSHSVEGIRHRWVLTVGVAASTQPCLHRGRRCLRKSPIGGRESTSAVEIVDYLLLAIDHILIVEACTQPPPFGRRPPLSRRSSDTLRGDAAMVPIQTDTAA
jgi:hypothetical protein